MPVLAQFRASDGYRFYYRHYPADGRPKARLVFIHGIRSHGEWYTRSCEKFAHAGYEVDFLDRRGAGLNTAYRGDTPAFRRLLDDIAEFIQQRRAERGWLPMFVGGISWGGKLAVGLPYRRPNLVDGLILLCPGLVPRIAPPWGRRMRIALARVLRPWKFFPIPLNEPELFTASDVWQRYIADDVRGLREATARFLFSSFALDIYLQRAARRVTVPTLLLLAEEDRIIDNSQTAAFVQRFPGPVHICTYPNAHHTLEFEDAQHPWLADTLNWLESQLA
ncbi:MAG: alpha/beta fold hydrolase [Gemmataceae bacterium]|nr:lysophospholipase [Gemmata sp.]MDW8196577.1 alpha/beta fold hydrolase [Gemmataceae bacterium]